MKASSIVLLAAVVVILGRWSKNEPITSKIVVGGLFSALVISLLDSAQPRLAKGFAYLFLVGAALNYSGTILQNTTGVSAGNGKLAPGGRRVQ